MKTLTAIMIGSLLLLSFSIWATFSRPTTKATQVLQDQNNLFDQLVLVQKLQIETTKELVGYIEGQYKMFMLVVERQNDYMIKSGKGKRDVGKGK